MVQDVKKCYNCKIEGIGDMEIREAYDKLCKNDVLKEEFKIVELEGFDPCPRFSYGIQNKMNKDCIKKNI